LTRFGIALRICSTSSVGSSSFDHHEPLPQPARPRESTSTDFEDTMTYRGVSKLYQEKTGKDPIYAIMPEVVISGPKLSRDYNTNWFATRVDGRYQTCMRKIKNLKL